MPIFDKSGKSQTSDPNEFWNRISEKVNLDRQPLLDMPREELGELISKAQGWYIQALSAEAAGEIEAARKCYQRAFTLLPTHIEALDNHAIGLVEEFRFSEAIPFFEQSAAAEPSSPLAFVYLVKCYEETGAMEESASCARYLLHHWPDKSPYIDWSHLGKPEPKQLIAPPLEEGQVWNYKTRNCDENSRVWIRLIEPGPAGKTIVHISVTDVRAPNGSLKFFSHLPYDADALLDCVTSRLNEKQTWDCDDDHFGEGYGLWREAYNSGEAGIFTAPLNEVLEGLVQAIPGNE
jgi:tetratricopeptide (TPR) repeat protein